MEVSPALCRAATIPPRAATFCDTGDPLPGGQYGVELRSAFKRFVVEFGPRVSSFPQAFTPEERFAGLEVLQPEIERALEESIESISALEPPAEFQADHDRLIQYLEETLDTARAITAAAAARDFPKTQEQFARSGEVLCTAYTDLSHEFRSLVSFFFTPQACGEGP